MMKHAAIGITAILTAAWCLSAQELKPPRVVTAPVGGAPSDAIVLFDGKSLDQWTAPDGKTATWEVKGGVMTVKGGGLVTKKEFGDMQLHIEWASPKPPKGTGQDRGNSGVYLQGIYEVQVLDSFQNETYADGSAGAVYKQYAPLVNCTRMPGEWQTYDIIFHAPIFDANGQVMRPATLTLIHNGVVTQDHVEIKATPGGVRNVEGPKGPIFLQDHNHPVKFRNVWVREL